MPFLMPSNDSVRATAPPRREALSFVEPSLDDQFPGACQPTRAQPHVGYVDPLVAGVSPFSASADSIKGGNPECPTEVGIRSSAHARCDEWAHADLNGRLPGQFDQPR